MTEDSGAGPRAVDPTERAHLRDERGFSPPVHRFVPSPDLADVVRRFWLPVWSLPPGGTTVQRVLQYPVCLLVVSTDYALLVGPSSALSTQELTGTGWAVGAMLQPGAGALLLDEPGAVTDTALDLTSVSTLPDSLVPELRAAMATDPSSENSQRRAVETLESALRALGPLDEEGLLLNAVVEHVEGDPDVLRVGQICAKFQLTERSLQRLTARRIGLSPTWLIQRRRLHEAAERLQADASVDLARLAVDLGYVDQAHFGRDWRRVTGLTPRGFAAEPRP